MNFLLWGLICVLLAIPVGKTIAVLLAYRNQAKKA